MSDYQAVAEQLTLRLKELTNRAEAIEDELRHPLDADSSEQAVDLADDEALAGVDGVTRVPERLEKRAREIVEALDGTWSRSRGMCCCPAQDDRTPSLSVTIGVRAILFHCFAGCSNEAVLASLDRVGVKAAELFDGRGDPIAPRTREDVVNQNALRLWRAASALSGSPAQAYLAGRQIRALSPDLRYHARTPLGPKGSVRFLPAMLAAVRNDEGISAHILPPSNLPKVAGR